MMPKIRISLLLICCLLSIASFANTVTWIGGDGDWENPSMWDTGIVPENGDEDVILTVGNISLHSYAYIRSLRVMSDASILIAAGSEIVMLPDAGVTVPIEVQGNVVVEGSIYSYFSSGFAGEYYVVMQGNGTWRSTVNSQVWLDGGGIRLEDATNSFTNKGFLTVFGGENSELLLYTNGRFVNEREGAINMDIGSMDAAASGANIHQSGELVNKGDFQWYGHANSFLNQNWLYNSGYFLLVGFRLTNSYNSIIENRRQGHLEIRNLDVVSFAVFNFPTSRLKNWGQFTVKQATGANALCNNGRVDNYRVGRMNLSGDYLYGHARNKPGATWNNYGRLTCGVAGAATNYGLYNEGDFRNRNSGQIEIRGSYQHYGLKNTGVLLNQSYLWCSGAVLNEDLIDNAQCAELVLNDDLTIASSGTLGNYGWLRWPSNATLTLAGDFENEGLIEDPYNNINISQLTNNSVLAQTKTQPVFVGDNPNFMVLGYWGQITTDGACYKEPKGEQIGTYDPTTNIFTAWPNAEGIEQVYFAATLPNGECATWFFVGIEDGIWDEPAPLTGGAGSSSAAYGLQVYPNPTTDLLQLRLSANEQEEYYHWSIYNLQGREMNRGTTTSGQVLHELDLTLLPAGTYLLHLHNTAGASIYTERVIKQ